MAVLVLVYHLRRRFEEESTDEEPFFTAATPKPNRTISPASMRHNTKKTQIENYRKGEGLMLNIHATHHGGTAFCDVIGRSGGPVASSKKEIAPSFACWFDDDNSVPDAEKTNYTSLLKRNFYAMTPWLHDETDTFIRALRPYFHMISWEYRGVDELQRNISETNWEHPRLLSVVITRHPISRLLAGSQNILIQYPGYNTGELSHAGWWDYATNPKRRFTDNFFFRMIEGTQRPKPKLPKNINANEDTAQNTSGTSDHQRRRLKKASKTRKASKERKQSKQQEYMYTEDNIPMSPVPIDSNLGERNYERAVSILNRFTIVLDIECLSEGIRELAKLVGQDLAYVEERIAFVNQQRKDRGKHKTKHLSLRERIGYDDVYDYLLEKNQWDLRLYEYSKTVSLVRCEK